MKNLNIKNGARKVFKIFLWVISILVILFIILTISRIPHYFQVQKTNDQIVKIHNTKLSIDDVMGKNLPADPGVEANKTVQGIDANNNGIRDDVELAIFKEYPNSAKTRAVLLQYALTLQMMANQPFVNEEIATTIAEKESQSYDCVGSIVPRGENDLSIIDKFNNFIEIRQLNTIERKKVKNDFDNKTRSFELKSGCDIDLSKLLN